MQNSPNTGCRPFSGKPWYCLLLFALFAHSSQAQRNEQVSQRFSLQVDDLLDLGFIDEKKGYTNTESNDVKDLFEDNKIPQFEFRIRTNEPFRLTIQTMAEDSTGMVDADSLLQISLGDEEKGKDNDDFRDVNNKPTPLLDENGSNSGKTFNIKYRAKPGAKAPPDLKKLSLVFTASYP